MRKRVENIAALTGAICTLVLLPIPRSVSAAEWFMQPSVRGGREHNDNIQLTIQPHNGVTGTMISPKLDLGVSSDIWLITGSAETLHKWYTGQEGLDRDDWYYNLLTSYKTERSMWQLSGGISKSSTLANEQISPTTGLIQAQKAYDTHSVSPSWTWTVNELTQLQLVYSFDSVSYVDGQSVGLLDYVTRDTSARLSYQLSAGDQIFVSTAYSLFIVPATTFESKSASYEAGFTRTFSETTHGTLSAGINRNTSQQDALVCTVFLGPLCLQTASETLSSKKSSSIYSGNLEKQFETTNLMISIGRAYSPTGLGGEVLTDSVNVTLNRQISSQLAASFMVGNYDTKPATANVHGVNSHLYSIEPGLHWIWRQEWSADLTYQYSHIKREGEPEPASSNALYLTVRYAWPKMGISR